MNMIRVRAPHYETRQSAHYLDEILIQRIRYRALANTGSAVNYIRDDLIGHGRFSFILKLCKPTGQLIANQADFIVEMIDGTPQKLYCVPGLTENVILGEPYFSSVTPADVLHIQTIQTWEDNSMLRILSSTKELCLNEFIGQAKRDGVIRPNTAPISSNILFVPKKNGALRQ